MFGLPTHPGFRLASITLLLVSLPFVAHAQSVELEKDVVGSGGTEATSSAYTLAATAGQTAASVSSSSTYTIRAGFWYGGAGSVDQTTDITFTDGRSGAPYTPPSLSPGTNNNPIGRLKLGADRAGASLSSVTISNYAPTPSGVSSIELWTSTDNSFDAGSDTEVASTSYADNASFSSLSVSIPTDDVYVFVAVDLASDAAGDYEPAIQDETKIGFSDGTLSTVNSTQTSTFSDAYLTGSSNTLPVQLTQLEGATTDDGVRLTWRTASETNNAGFKMQRRVEDTDEATDWTTVGQRDGAGTTSEPQSYQFTDSDLPFAADSLTYRLQQIDTNGSTQTSKSVTVERPAQHLSLKKVFPNPAHHRITIRYAVPEKTKEGPDAAVRLYDVLGRQVQNVALKAEAGRHEVKLDVSDLASGLYILRLRAGDQTRTRRMTVVQ